jgi:hypothetical protein
MKKIVTILFLSVATIMWFASTIVPHHHHDNVIIFGSSQTHSDCNDTSCNNHDENKCCDKNNCKECPFSKGNDLIIKNSNHIYDDDIKFLEYKSFDVIDYKFDFECVTNIKFYTHSVAVKATLNTESKGLRAPPFA